MGSNVDVLCCDGKGRYALSYADSTFVVAHSTTSFGPYRVLPARHGIRGTGLAAVNFRLGGRAGGNAFLVIDAYCSSVAAVLATFSTACLSLFRQLYWDTLQQFIYAVRRTHSLLRFVRRLSSREYTSGHGVCGPYMWCSPWFFTLLVMLMLRQRCLNKFRVITAPLVNISSTTINVNDCRQTIQHASCRTLNHERCTHEWRQVVAAGIAQTEHPVSVHRALP